MVSFPRRSGQHPQRPEMFENWAPAFPQASGAVSSAIKALVEEYRGLVEQHGRIMKDDTTTQGARVVRSAKLARTKLEPLVANLDAAVTGATTHAEQMRAKIAQVYDPPDKKYEMVMRHQEVRAHFKASSQSERLKLLEAARTAGDDDTLIAVASVAPFLSGLPQQLHDYARETLVERHAPQEAALMASLTEQVGYAKQFKDTMLQSMSDTVDFAKADELMAAAKDELSY